MVKKKILYSIGCIGLFSLLSFCFLHTAESQNFPEKKIVKEHFIVYYEKKPDIANKLAWKAEYCYQRILRQFGIADFHPWEADKKCIILLYRDRNRYADEMKVEGDSNAKSIKDKNLFGTFEKAPRLEERILPHEITHLMLWEYFGAREMPLWLTEGMAQYAEENVYDYSYKKIIMKKARDKEFIKLEELFRMKYCPNEKERLELFLAESASVVDYMKSRFSQPQFSEFIGELKDGQPAEDAIMSVYKGKYPKGIQDFQKGWLGYVTTRY